MTKLHGCFLHILHRDTKMRCSYYCCGETYDLKEIAQEFLALGSATTMHDPEVLMIRLGAKDKFKDHYVFFFSYGCVVFWGLSKQREDDILKEMSKYLHNSLEDNIVDVCQFDRNSQESLINEETDTIHLSDDDPYVKLSISYGLSQSVKLQQFEDSVLKSIETNKKIPEDIIKKGKIQFSRKALAVKIGELLAERNSINLHSTILDTPEFFWRRPKYETYYDMSVDFMDIDFRLNILNKRLEVLHDLFEVLSNELQHVHASRLEIIIIILIMIEVIISLSKEIFGIF